MGSTTMGRVLTEATIENLQDLYEVKLGHRAPEAVRRVTVADALVDTGSTTLSIPASTAPWWICSDPGPASASRWAAEPA